MPVHMPISEAEIEAFIRDSQASKSSLRIIGGGTRSGMGRPVEAAQTISTARLSGITLYEPSEMVIGAKAGTPLAEIEATLASKGQMLPFEPMDHRALYGKDGVPTIGAVAAGNISGSRRIWSGACRDSLIGVRFINGLGESIKSGGRVMKNVTGLDLVKLQAGAWGTLGVLTEVIFKVVPRPEIVATLMLEGLDDSAAIRAMSAALGSPFEITGAAHDSEAQSTYLRIEGFDYSVDYRAGELAKLLRPFGVLSRIDGAESLALWASTRDCAMLSNPSDRAIWRLSVKPSTAPEAVAAIKGRRDATALYDWGGGLIWIATSADGDAGADTIRTAASAARGYATLIRAPDALRADIPVFHPEAAPIAAVSRRIKASFDPLGVFNPGLMYAEI